VIEWALPQRRPLSEQPVALASLAWLTLVVLGALLAPALAPGGPLRTHPEESLLPPGPGHPLGTDLLGRDVGTRLAWGGRWTLGMGALGLALAVGVGLPVGLVAGTFGGPVETVLMRLVDALLAFPSLLLAMAIVALMEPGLVAVSAAVGLAAAPAYARVTRGVALEVRTQPYVEAARAVGGTGWHILRRHVLPNAAGPLLAFAATQFGWVLLNGAALNFLGLGAPLGVPEWGAMLAEGRGYLRDAPWISAFPGLALTLTVLAVNLVSDGLQESLGPR
jgi:ABC-type dipeptide/oligopeptide/nickel transport system permease subunit